MDSNTRPVSVRPVLTIDPGVQGGAVCVDGTRIPASTVGSIVWQGDPVCDVAQDYGITRADVLLACWWWADQEQYQRTKFGRSVRKRWGAWIETAHAHFAHSLHIDKLDDPPQVTR